MEANYCPVCAHCRMLKEIDEKAAKVKKRRQDMEEEQRLMEEELRAEEKRVKEEGIIYGDHYDLYSLADIQNITNFDFLEEMLEKIYPCAQPQTEEELEDLHVRYNAVSKRLNDVLLENLE